jgi:hypothetical protein
MYIDKKGKDYLPTYTNLSDTTSDTGVWREPWISIGVKAKVFYVSFVHNGGCISRVECRRMK